MSSAHNNDFKPYAWMRAISRSDLPKRCRDVLRMLAVEMEPGRPGVQIRQREMLEYMGMADDCSLRTSLDQCEELGWLAVDRNRRPHLYEATQPRESRDLTPDNQGFNPGKAGVPPRESRGSDQCQPRESRDSTPDNQGSQPRESRGSTSYREKKQRALDAAAARATDESQISEEAIEVQALLSTWGHDVSDADAESLTDDVREYHPSALDYIERRQDSDELLQRAKSTRWLLKTLRGDAARDGVRQSHRRRDPKPPKPATVETAAREASREVRTPTASPAESDHYEHPAVWTDALEQLAEQMSRHNFNSWLADIRAESSDGCLVLYLADEFKLEWVPENFGDLIEAAVDGEVEYRAIGS